MTRKSPLEKSFKKKFIALLEQEYGGACRITSNDPQLWQGIADSTMNCIFPDGTLYWTDLEFKRARNSAKQPNQEYYSRINGLFVNPENAEEVLNAIRLAVSEARQRARISKPK